MCKLFDWYCAKNEGERESDKRNRHWSIAVNGSAFHNWFGEEKDEEVEVVVEGKRSNAVNISTVPAHCQRAQLRFLKPLR